MKKIGIITHYYNSLNYGGNLQAYALCKYLMKCDVDVEQISYNKSHKKKIFQGTVKDILKNAMYETKKNILHFWYRNEIKTLSVQRNKAFYHFSKILIPHSDTVYTDENIKECLGEYDIFVTGSDQVWNLTWYRRPFFLDFVSDEGSKISYAASISLDVLDDEQKEIFSNSLKSYKAISVREDMSVNLLKDILDKDVELVLDPTFLLDIEDWEAVCSERIVGEKYIFAYFLGYREGIDDIVMNYARNHNLRVVTIPYASGNWKRNGRRFRDIEIMDASPEMFLSLVKYSECVFTDSFHAIVFSFIFKKQFYVFNRDKQGSMKSRIISLTSILDLQDRFCMRAEQESIEYIENLSEIDYSVCFNEVEKMREKSYKFIQKNIIEN